MKLLDEERTFVEQLMKGKIANPAGLLVLVGKLEEAFIDTWDAEALAPRMQQLSGYGLRFRFELLQDKTHNTVPTRSVTPTLPYAFETRWFVRCRYESEHQMRDRHVRRCPESEKEPHVERMPRVSRSRSNRRGIAMRLAIKISIPELT